MQVFSLYAHEEPSSLTSSLRHTAEQVLTRQGHQVVTSDLYAMNFQAAAHKWDFTTLSGGHFNYMFEQQHAARMGKQFAPDIAAEMEKVKAADLVLIHFPLWWGSVPAVLKGWLDRVLAMGFAWDGDHIFDKGLLAGKRVMLVVTAGEPESYFTETGPQKGSIIQLLKPVLHSTLAFCGLKNLPPHIVYGVTTADQTALTEEITKFAQRVEGIATEQRFLQW